MLSNNESDNNLLSLVRIQWQCKANCVTLETCQEYRGINRWNKQLLRSCFQNFIRKFYEHSMHVYMNCYIEFWKHVIVLSILGPKNISLTTTVARGSLLILKSTPPSPHHPNRQIKFYNKLEIILSYLSSISVRI